MRTAICVLAVVCWLSSTSNVHASDANTIMGAEPCAKHIKADVVAFGDSITEGVGSTNETVSSWPALLS
jgi:lysophospholipase L1-like esterase